MGGGKGQPPHPCWREKQKHPSALPLYTMIVHVLLGTVPVRYTIRITQIPTVFLRSYI